MNDMKIDVVWDMETQDPDDYLTLLLLCGHPQVNLKAVTITPGSRWQVGLVRRTLAEYGLDIPVGAHRLDHPKTCVSRWHERAYGAIEPSGEARPGGEVLAEACDERTTLITGAPLKSLGAAMQVEGFTVGRWVAQGGFAGEGVVPPELQLEKFKGLTTCPTFNLNGDPKAALRALDHPGVGARYLVSKNVCHKVVYDREMHEALAAVKGGRRSLEAIWRGMEVYLGQPGGPALNEDIEGEVIQLIDVDGHKVGEVPRAEALARAQAAGLPLVQVGRASSVTTTARIMAFEPRPERGKKMHDPLAACCAIDLGIGEWREVEVYRERGKWGARLSPGSGTHIIIDYDHQRFFEALTARPEEER